MPEENRFENLPKMRPNDDVLDILSATGNPNPKPTFGPQGERHKRRKARRDAGWTRKGL